MTQTLNRNKIIAIILCFTMLFSITSGIFTEAFAAEEEMVEENVYDVTEGGRITLPHNQKVTLTVKEAERYQWQTYISVGDTGIWVNIHDAYNQTLDISYAMLANALTDRDTAELRCQIGEDEYTEVVEVWVDFSDDASVEMLNNPLQMLPFFGDEEGFVKDENTNGEEGNIQTPDENTNGGEGNTQTPDENTNGGEGNTQTPDENTNGGEGNTQTPDENTNGGEGNTQTPDENTNDGDGNTQTPDANTNGEEGKGFSGLLTGAVNKLQQIVTPTTPQADTNSAPLTFSSPAPETNVVTMGSSSPSSVGFALNREAASDASSSEKYIIEIEYIFSNGTQAATSWTASVVEGSNLDVTVPNPTVIGYKPQEGEFKNQVTIDLTNITSHKKYTVRYVPAQVSYTVEHYLQNVDDDEYTLIETQENLPGFTEDLVPANLAKVYTNENGEVVCAEGYEGTYALLYEQPEIAADGSTVVKIKYDRYYYLMSFNLDGGYGVEPIYARYGAEIGEAGDVGTPTKAGYTFQGWEPDTIPAKMPVGGGAFKAKWEPGEVNYTVVFWYENADNTGYSEAGWTKVTAEKAGTIVNGEAFKNNAFDGRDTKHFKYSHADNNVTVKGDGSTVVNVYFTRNVYTLTYVMDNWADDCTTAGTPLHERHTDACYTLSCGLAAHTHSAECGVGTCVIEEHPEHNADCCTIEATTHTHTEVCYIDSSAGYYNNGKCGYGHFNTSETEGNTYSHSSRTCVFHNGDWYIYKMGGAVNNNTCAASGTHTHGDGNCTCEKTVHTHSEACLTYSCGEVVHTHSSVGGDCYRLSCGKHLHYHSGNTCYLVVTAKYDADITSVWQANPVKSMLDDGYVFESNVTGYKYSFLEKMPEQNITLTALKWSGSKHTWYYYLEVLPGTDATGDGFKTDNGKSYQLYDDTTIYGSKDVYLTYNEDYYPITGFTQRDSDVPAFQWNSSANAYLAYLYYTRNSYNLTFSNHGTVVSGHGGSFKYQADISGQNFTPAYPSNLEKGAYVFDGWYTSPFFGDTKFNFTTTVDGETVKATMPANNLTLYAKWVPKDHNVNIYLTKADGGTLGNKVGDTQVVAHREVAANPYPDLTNDPPKHPDSDKYKFVGWFYMDGDTEKAFDFSMPVTQDLNLYAKWSSNVLMEYTIHYKLTDGTTIAPDTKGSALAGSTKTFEAKTGDDLLDDYQTSYFPNTNSHSLTIDIEDKTKNEFTFVYTKKPNVDYTVRYLIKNPDGTTEPAIKNADGSEYIYESSTSNAVITETFRRIDGYMPDDYQKRLVLSANKEENVITFFYVADTVHAPVHVIHYTQNIEGDGYSEYQEYTDLNGIMNNSYSASILTLNGFTFNTDKTSAENVEPIIEGSTVSGVVSENGLELKLYYDRIEYPYEFRFQLEGTAKRLAEPEGGSARYQAQVTEYAKQIPGYTLVSPNAQAITIDIETGDAAKNNVKVFEYKEEQVTIKYEPVGSGKVDNAAEVVFAVTGPVQGSMPEANDGYKFDGWYKDKNCTQPVNAEWVGASTKLTPQQNSSGVYVAATYYAKFVEDKVTIKYVVDGAGGMVTRAEEEVNTVTGNPQGSVAKVVENAIDDYRFVGWYSSEGKLLSTNAKFVPAKVNGANVAATYYAKFEPLIHITIHKTVDVAYDDNETFVFKVKGQNTGIEVDVTVAAGEYVTVKSLPKDTYTVTEVNSGWRYDKAAVQSTDATKTLTFDNTTKNNKWLGWTKTVNNFFKKFN